ncbi:MAG: substrate-binding domain-containing protein [bacterium]
MKKIVSLVVISVLILGLAVVNITSVEAADVEIKDEYHFVMVPKTVHPWFDEVLKGAKEQAEVYEEIYDTEIKIDFRAPEDPSVEDQNKLLEEAAALEVDGITVDLLDAEANKVILEEIQSLDIPLVIFDSIPPEGMDVPYVGNDFKEQARLAAEELVDRLDEEGKVAIMDGVPEAPNHQQRTESYEETFAKYDDIEVVATGLAQDDIATAQEEASAIMSAHPDLDGFVFSDAAGPIGTGRAVLEAGKEDEIEVIGLEDLPQTLELFEEGVIDWSSCVKPRMQGKMFVKLLMHENFGFDSPQEVDTGIKIITEEDIPEDIDDYKSG